MGKTGDSRGRERRQRGSRDQLTEKSKEEGEVEGCLEGAHPQSDPQFFWSSLSQSLFTEHPPCPQQRTAHWALPQTWAVNLTSSLEH